MVRGSDPNTIQNPQINSKPQHINLSTKPVVTSKNAKQVEFLLRNFILLLICVVSFCIRLFSVLRYESIIHEFDPWFNFRSTRVLVGEGSYKFWNWFDSRSWYPLGRIVGGTVYPGIMYTAAFLHRVLNFVGLKVNIRDVCVLTAPIFSTFTALCAFGLTREASDTAAGLVAAAIISIVPGYISRSVAGSYDNEGVAITAMIFCFYLWTKSVQTGSLFWAGLTTLSYLYMVACWGGYIFLINLIPVYVLVMLFTGRYSQRLYVAYNTFYILGSLLSMQIRFVGFNAVQTVEHLGAFGTFGLLNLYCLGTWIRNFTGPRVFNALIRWMVFLAISVIGLAISVAFMAGMGGGMTGRIRTLIDPTYASNHMAIIASVSEHQPTAWGSYFFDLHITVYLMPIGLYFCFKKLSDANMFLITYGAFAVYFSGIMVRIMLVLAPAASMLTAIGISESMKFFMRSFHASSDDEEFDTNDLRAQQLPKPDENPAPQVDAIRSTSAQKRRTKPRKGRRTGEESGTDAASSPLTTVPEARMVIDSTNDEHVGKSVAILMIFGAAIVLSQYVRHAVWATSEAYSSPSIVLSTKTSSGHRIFLDDYREGYYWLRQNTPDDTKVMSWWDYGYQISGMANRTVIVDNNTWNNSHIATVGKAMNSPEEDAYKIVRKLDVDYVLIIFGGVVGYSSDDINKFLWMVRIASSVDKTVREQDYISPTGHGYTVDENAGQALKDSLMYRLSYYRFSETQGSGFDRVRQTHVKESQNIKLKYFEEAYTSENWIVRIYRVKKPNARGWM